MTLNNTVSIHDAFQEFLLSRKAMQCSPKTLLTYRSVLGRFIRWLETQGVLKVNQVTAKHIRHFMAQLSGKPWTLNGYGRAIRTLLLFWYSEELLPKKIEIRVPAVPKQKLPFLTSAQIRQVLQVCTPMERAIVLLIVDSGLRRQEVCALNIGDIDIQTGLIRVVQGKGKKDRIVFIGESTVKALLDLIPDINVRAKDTPLFRSASGKRLTGDGLYDIFCRLSKRSGIKVTPHMLRRSFATLSLKLGMDIVSLQTFMGHSSLETTRRYIQLLDDDLYLAHRKAGPVDRLEL